MKTYIFKIVAICTLIICSWSCTDDADTNIPIVPPVVDNNKAQIELYTNADNFQKPVVRSGTADETGVGSTPWVVVFHGHNNNAAFSEVVQAIVVGNKSYIQLTKTDQPSRLLIIANAPATFFNGSAEVAFNHANLTSFFTSEITFANAVDNFTTARLSQPNQTMVPYASTTSPHPMLPMTAIYDVSSITSNTTIGTSDSKVILTRSVAKVVVINSTAALTLISAAMVDTPVNGRFYQNGTTLKNNTGNLTDYLTSYIGDGVSGIAPATNEDTFANPMYVYESKKEEKAEVIIRATYNSVQYYYCIGFSTNTAQPRIDVERNKFYVFNIFAVYGPGSLTIEEAKAQTATNMRYTITVTDQVSYDMEENGEYYLGVSNSEYYLYNSDLVTTPLIALTISTNATNAMGITSNSITYTSTGPGGPLTVTPSVVTLAPSNGGIATTDVKVTADNYNGDSDGTLTITLGNIVKTVKLFRRRHLTAGASSLDFPSNSVSGIVTSQGNAANSWLSFSSTTIQGGGTPTLVLPAAGDMHLIFPENVYVFGEQTPDNRTGGEAYVTRSNGNGRIKLILNQDANFILPD